MTIDDRIYVIVSTVSGDIIDVRYIKEGDDVYKAICSFIQVYYRYDQCDMEDIVVTTDKQISSEFIYMPVKEWRKTRR